MHTSPSQRYKGRATSPSANTFSYELFELAHVLRVRPRASLQTQNEATNTARSKY